MQPNIARSTTCREEMAIKPALAENGKSRFTAAKQSANFAGK
jgi:hypothetical protein